MIALLLFTACRSTSSTQEPVAPDGEPAAEDTEPQDPEYAAQLAVYKSKQKACDELGALAEETESGTAIVSINDKSQLEGVADKRRELTRRIAAVTVELPELGTLRDRYVGLSTDIAAAISEAAAQTSDKDKKAALGRYKELDAKVQPLLDEISQVCNAPIEGD